MAYILTKDERQMMKEIYLQKGFLFSVHLIQLLIFTYSKVTTYSLHFKSTTPSFITKVARHSEVNFYQYVLLIFKVVFGREVSNMKCFDDFCYLS